MQRYSMSRVILAAAAVTYVMSANAGFVLAGETLTASQIKKFVPGRAKARVSGSAITISLSRRGTLRGKWAGERDTGKWHVSGHRLCIRFNKWLGGGTRCSTVSRSGNAYRVSGMTFVKY